MVSWRDTPKHYGKVSRTLHWLTAKLVVFQFMGVLAWRVMGENTLTLLLARIGPHGSLGIEVSHNIDSPRLVMGQPTAAPAKPGKVS